MKSPKVTRLKPLLMRADVLYDDVSGISSSSSVWRKRFDSSSLSVLVDGPIASRYHVLLDGHWVAVVHVALLARPCSENLDIQLY
jgi:hypothetical protein